MVSDSRGTIANTGKLGAGACGPQLADGLYSLEYLREDGAVIASGQALAVLRQGLLIGSDDYGGVFEGQLARSACGSVSCVAFTLRIPPGGVLLTGERWGAQEAEVDVVGVLSHIGENLGVVCDLFGKRLIVQFRYVGTLSY